jgi:hypothetical protein
MLALLFLLVCIAFGYVVVGLFRLSLTRFEHFIYGTTLGLSLSGYLGLGLSYILGFNRASQTILLLLLGIIAGGGMIAQRYFHMPALDKKEMAKGKPQYVLLVPLMLILLWNGWTVLSQFDHKLWINNSHNYGDIRLHLAYVNTFLFGQNIPVESPILSGTPPSYPFLIDFITAQFIVLGAPFILTFKLMAMLGYLLLTGALYIFTKRITKSKVIASLTPILLLLNGSIGFFTEFLPQWKSAGFTLHFFLNTPHDYSLIQDKGYYFGNSLLVLFGTQRSLLLGFPLALMILGELYLYNERTKSLHYLFLALLTVCLVLIHTSSLLVVALYLLYKGLKIIIDAPNKGKIIQRWAVYLLPVLAAGGLLVVLFLSQAGSVLHSIRFSPGWIDASRPTDTFYSVWLKSGTHILPISLVALYFLYRHDRKAGLFTGYAYIIFILANILIIHPWMWDNMKYFLYWYTLTTIPIAYFIVMIWEEKRKFFAIILTLLLTLSGAMDLFRRTIPNKNWFPIITESEITSIEAMRATIAPEDYVLTYGYMLNPIVMQLGRRLVFGDEAWLWSHGIKDYPLRLNKIKRIYSGTSEAKALINELNISYVVVSSNERALFYGLNELFFQQNFPVVYQDTSGTVVYRVKNAH